MDILSQITEIYEKAMVELNKLPIEKRQEILEKTQLEALMDENIKNLKQKLDELKY